MKKLFVAYLGGRMPGGRLGEEHEVVVLVADNRDEAKVLARKKWSGEVKEGAHVDFLHEIGEVDGFVVSLAEKTASNPNVVSCALTEAASPG